MIAISIEQLSEKLTKNDFNHQLRDDGKIDFLAPTETFKDADGDSSLFTCLWLPFENVLYISVVSLFTEDQVKSNMMLLDRLNAFNCSSIAGQFCCSNNGVYWQTYLYVDGSIEQIEEHIHGSISNLISFLDHHIDEEAEIKSNESVSSEKDSDLLIDRLEESFMLDCPEEALQPARVESIIKAAAYKTTSGLLISMSANLSNEARRYAEANIDKLTAYLEKSMLSLPTGLALSVQHGNDSPNVLEGPNKGPYLVVVNEDGKEKKSAKVFMSKRGRLNSYIAVSTILTRL